MAEKQQSLRSEILPIIIMGVLFIVIHGLSLALAEPFMDAGIEPVWGEEGKNNPANVLQIIIIMLVITAAILIIAKYLRKYLIQLLILGAVGYSSFIGFFYPLFTIILPIQEIGILLALSAITGFVLVLILYKFPEWYVIDISGVIVGVAAIIIFGISISILLVILLLVALALYDAISVYKTKHMIDLADTVMDLKLPVLLVIPKTRHYSLIKETKRLKDKLKDNDKRDAFFMGLGDIVMPGILVVSAYMSVENGLYLALSILAGTLVGFAVLMTFVLKGKPQAGLPCLCSGAIIGYLISSYLLYGEFIGLSLTF